MDTENKQSDVELLPSTEFKIPDGVNNNGYSELFTEGVVEAISGEYVKEALLDQSSDIKVPNYIIDFGDITDITGSQMLALTSMISDGTPSKATCIYGKTLKGFFELGDADSFKVDELLPLVISKILGDGARVIKDFIPGVGGKVIKPFDNTMIRLRL